MIFLLDDVHNIAERVFQFAHDQPQIVYQALIWVLLRRCEKTPDLVTGGEGVVMAEPPHLPDLSGLCESLFAADSGPARDRSRYGVTGPQFSQCLATVCLTLHGDLSDPTGGATHFHHHRDDPEWARCVQPVALIGDYFFYNRGSAIPS